MQLHLLTVPHMVGQLADNMQKKLDDFQDRYDSAAKFAQ